MIRPALSTACAVALIAAGCAGLFSVEPLEELAGQGGEGGGAGMGGTCEADGCVDQMGGGGVHPDNIDLDCAEQVWGTEICTQCEPGIEDTIVCAGGPGPGACDFVAGMLDIDDPERITLHSPVSLVPVVNDDECCEGLIEGAVPETGVPVGLALKNGDLLRLEFDAIANTYGVFIRMEWSDAGHLDDLALEPVGCNVDCDCNNHAPGQATQACQQQLFLFGLSDCLDDVSTTFRLFRPEWHGEKPVVGLLREAFLVVIEP